MGGKAFLSRLPNATFPRLSPTIYASVKSTLLPRLTLLFQHVGVPHEAPEKEDHGDVDFVVACPYTAIGHERIKSVLGAIACIPSTQPDGRGSHNFALRLADVVTSLPTDAVPVPGETSEVYIQVDVNIRKDVQDWDNAMIFHSYGDLGMIVGRLAASVGLHVGELGLKVSLRLFGRIGFETNVCPDNISSTRANILSHFPVVNLDPGHISLHRTLHGTMEGRV
jgi:hypothetical protein